MIDRAGKAAVPAKEESTPNCRSVITVSKSVITNYVLETTDCETAIVDNKSAITDLNV